MRGAQRTVAKSAAKDQLGNMLVVWAFVASSAACLGTAFWQRTGDVRILISALAAPLVIGVILLMGFGLTLLTLPAPSRVQTPDGPGARSARVAHKNLYGRRTKTSRAERTERRAR
jgi:hypothetical protein